MQTREEKQRIVNMLVKAIRSVMKEIDPTIEIKDEPIAGILIMQFPEDHRKDGTILTTVAGRICFTHAFENLDDLFKRALLEGNQLAS